MAPALRRRDVIAGGGLVAVGGILVACGGGDSASEDTAASAEAAPSPSQTADASTPEAAPSSAEETKVDDGEGAEEAASQEAVDGLASVDEIPVEGGVVISDPPVVLVQPTSGDFQGFSAVCPHQGCLVSSVESNEILSVKTKDDALQAMEVMAHAVKLSVPSRVDVDLGPNWGEAK